MSDNFFSPVDFSIGLELSALTEMRDGAVVAKSLDLVFTPDPDTFEIEWRFAEGLSIRGRPDISAARRATTQRAYRARNDKVVKACDRARYKGERVEKKRGQTALWKTLNPLKVRAQKQRERNENYHRPFVAIDAEGCDYPEHDIRYGEEEYIEDGETKSRPIIYPRHRTFLWGAWGWKRASSAHDLAQGKSKPRGGENLPDTWLGEGKRPLRSREIIDWLLSLPEIYGDVNFTMFSFGYDITQILLGLPRETVWEILKRKTYPDKEGRTKKIQGSTFYGPYAIKYIKGKIFYLARLRYPDDPDKYYDGRGSLDTVASITIYDAFGFYSGFCGRGMEYGGAKLHFERRR